MLKPKILVTGATGKTGGATLTQLLAKGFPIRALVRRNDARAESLAKAGAEVTIGSLEDFGALQAAMNGVARAYFCPPLEPGALRRATLFAAAAEAAKVEVVVQLSQWVSDAVHPAAHAREKWLSNKVMTWSRHVDVVTVRPGWFADNYFAALGPIAQFGLMGLPLGEGKNAPPSNEDIARVIVACLVDPKEHVGKAYRPTGPRLLTPDEIAAIFGKVLGRKVRYQNTPLLLFLKVAKALGVSDYVISQLYWFLQDYQSDAFGVGAPTDVVAEIGGAPPESFEQIARRYVERSPAAKRGVGGWSQAAVNLIKAMATPAPNIKRIEERYGTPAIDNARLARDSALWRESHEPVGALKAGAR
jgi:NAD(P)H dehydrogenase (quinone)